MRDILVTLLVIGGLPAILFQPYVGVLMWSWIGYMNPHRLSWGFAADFPFAQIVAIVTLVALLFSREPKRIPWTRETIILLFFILWMLVTTYFALRPELAWLQMEKVAKIQLMTYVTMMLMYTRHRLNMLIWVIVFSLGFFGVKGGIFTILSGGGDRVMGPPGTFIGGNNEVGLALIMLIPLMRYLQLQVQKRWQWWALTAAICLTVIAVLGTQSRGAFIGIAAMSLFLLFKSRKKMLVMVMLAVMIPTGFLIMPQSWHNRMKTIQTYEESSSMQGRFDAWRFAYETALERPAVGGGYFVFYGRTDAHSIYFEVLGEHGFVGLFLFLLLMLLTWRSGSWIRKKTADEPGMGWANDLASMLQVSMIGYAVSGASLGLAYFDLYYHLIALMVLTRIIVTQQLAEKEGKSPADTVALGTGTAIPSPASPGS